MKTIELYIKDNGRIVCVLYDERGIAQYCSFNDYIKVIYNILKRSENVKVYNDNISFNTDRLKVIIKYYQNNINNDLEVIIKTAKRIFMSDKKKKLKKRRIKRVAAISSTVILSLGILSSTLLNNDIDVSKVKANNIDNSISNEVNVIFDNKSDSDIVLLDKSKTLENVLSYDLSYEDRTDTDKFVLTKENYFSIIETISNEYGIDPKIMLAIATQESGVHRAETDGPALGLMQIELSVWDGETIFAYNYKLNKEETLKVTKDKLKDLEFNVRVACMYFQNCLKNSNYNLEVAIQMYNYGYGNVLKTFKMYYGNNDIKLNDVLNNYDNGWLECRDNINVGDKEYLEHVVSYIEDVENLSCLKDNELVFYSFNNNLTKSKKI